MFKKMKIQANTEHDLTDILRALYVAGYRKDKLLWDNATTVPVVITTHEDGYLMDMTNTKIDDEFLSDYQHVTLQQVKEMKHGE